MKNDDKKFKIKLVLLWVFAFSVMIFIMSSSAKAETINPLPYYVNANYSEYFHLTSTQIDLITSYTSTSNENLFWLGEPYNYSSTYWGVYLFGLNTSDTNTISLKSSDLSYDVDYGMFDVDTNFVEVSRTGGTYIKKIIRINKTTGEWSFANASTFPSIRDVTLLHLSTRSINEYGYTVGVPFLFQDTQPIYYQGDLNKPIFLNGTPIPPTPEDENITDDTEKPSFSDYTVDWTTGKPTFDTDHPFDSLFNIMSWSFGKLGDTLTGGFNFIVDSLNWSLQTFLNNVRAKFQLVIDAVNDIGDLIEDFIESVNGFLSDIKDKLSDFFDDFVEFADLFIHPFDEEEFEDQIENCELINQYNELMDNADDIKAIFNNAEERDYFVLYIDFENPFADSEHKIIHSEISFTWLKDYRSSYRPFLWLFTMIECFVGGMRLLGGIIGGKAK